MRGSSAAVAIALAVGTPQAWADDAAPPPGTTTGTPATATTGAPPKELTRLDLSVPNLPTLVDLDLSTDRVTRPSTALDFATSLANGFSADGSFHDGVAIEVAPFGLAGATSSQATALRLSIATVALTKDGKTSGKAAVGLRWSVGTYNPTVDPALRSCLAANLPRMQPVPETGSLPETGVTEPVDEAGKRDIDLRLQSCRDRARGAHLAQSALEIAAVVDGTSTDGLQLTHLGAPHTGAWLLGSVGWNSYRDTASEAPRHPFGVQPTVMARVDLTDTMTGTRRDVFAGVRLPAAWDTFGLFVEAGITVGDLSHVQSTATAKTERLGAGFDYRISDGSWLGSTSARTSMIGPPASASCPT